MGQLSKRQRRLAREKRETSLQRREWKLERAVLSQEMMTLKVLLFSVLAQAGGELEATEGTREQVGEGLARFRVEGRAKEGDEKTLVVKLVEIPEEQPEEPALTITKIEEDE